MNRESKLILSCRKWPRAGAILALWLAFPLLAAEAPKPSVEEMDALRLENLEYRKRLLEIEYGKVTDQLKALKDKIDKARKDKKK